MRFWDASAVVSLIVDEPRRAALFRMIEEDGDLLVWWGTPVEVASALARRERERELTADVASAAFDALHEISASWHEVVPSDAVRRTAVRLLRSHALRAADSTQLAAALVAADHDARTLPIVCLDERLAAGARREGFAVIAV